MCIEQQLSSVYFLHSAVVSCVSQGQNVQARDLKGKVTSRVTRTLLVQRDSEVLKYETLTSTKRQCLGDINILDTSSFMSEIQFTNPNVYI